MTKVILRKRRNKLADHRQFRVCAPSQQIPPMRIKKIALEERSKLQNGVGFGLPLQEVTKEVKRHLQRSPLMRTDSCVSTLKSCSEVKKEKQQEKSLIYEGSA